MRATPPRADAPGGRRGGAIPAVGLFIICPMPDPKGHARSTAVLLRNLVAGLTLAAITIPEQMATAKLGGFAPNIGLYAFIAATLGFALFGASRVLTVGADSTITPIFSAVLGALAAAGAGTGGRGRDLAALVGALLLAAGLLRLGWIADMLSTPIITGFLAGIAVHIVVSQLPDVMGIAKPAGNTPQQIVALVHAAPQARRWPVAIALGVLALTLLTEWLEPAPARRTGGDRRGDGAGRAARPGGARASRCWARCRAAGPSSCGRRCRSRRCATCCRWRC